MKPTIRTAPQPCDPFATMSSHLQQHSIRVPHGVGIEAHLEHCPRTQQQQDVDDEEDAMWRRAAAYVRSGTRIRKA